MVVLPQSNRRPASTLMTAKYHDWMAVLQRAGPTRRDVIDPSIRSRSMDPSLAIWHLPPSSAKALSIVTWGIIFLLFLLIIVSIRTMVSTRTFRRRRSAYLRHIGDTAACMYSGEQQRVRATLKIGVDLGDSSVDLMVSPISFQILAAATDWRASRIFIQNHPSKLKLLHPTTPPPHLHTHIQIPFPSHRLHLRPLMDDSTSAVGRTAMDTFVSLSWWPSQATRPTVHHTIAPFAGCSGT
jgi:hypothetical protein